MKVLATAPEPDPTTPTPSMVAPQPAEAWPPALQAWWALFVFGVTLAVGFLDRGVISLMIQPIKHDLSLGDTQISLIMGFAFIAFYLILGLPLARWIDGGNRRLILGLCITVWSVATALCGTARNFWQLASFRVGVGAGDAGVSPAISSMVSDLFPQEKLARAMSLLALAFVCGNGLALVLGGYVIGTLSKHGDVYLPYLGTFHPWQITFLIVGLPGVLAALLYLTIPEPRRRGRQIGGAMPDVPALLAVLRYLVANRRAYGPMFLGLALTSLMTFGTVAWSPAYFARTHHWSAQQFGVTSGTIGMIASSIGLFSGFRFTEWFIRRGRDDANLRLTVWAHWLGFPFVIAMPLMPTPQLAIAMIAIGNMIGTSAIGSQNAAMMTMTPNQMRAQVTALYLVMYNVIGFGLGPTVVALLTDYLFRDESMLRWSLLTAAIILGPLGAISFTCGLGPYGRAVVDARRLLQ
jgi:MFS family permease